MITGYNTDVEHDGVTYHVQTEDKGLENPIVLSLVYTGGEILAAKRSSYADLITAGFEETALAERLKRQHRLICAAIHAGRLAELRQIGRPQTGRLPTAAASPHAPEGKPASLPPAEPPPAPAPAPSIVSETETAPPAPLATPPLPLEKAPPANGLTTLPPGQTGSLPSLDGSMDGTFGSLRGTGPSPYTVYDSRRRSRSGDVVRQPDGLRITLLGSDPDFRGGQDIQLKAIVTRIADGLEEPLSGAAISVKLLGTTFRPALFSVKTDSEGVMSVSIRIPPFLSGRAAIVAKASKGDLSTEARWVVHPGK